MEASYLTVPAGFRWNGEVSRDGSLLPDCSGRFQVGGEVSRDGSLLPDCSRRFQVGGEVSRDGSLLPDCSSRFQVPVGMEASYLTVPAGFRLAER